MVEYLGEVESSIVEVVEHSLARILGEIGDRDLILRVVRKALENVRGQRRWKFAFIRRDCRTSEMISMPYAGNTRAFR